MPKIKKGDKLTNEQLEQAKLDAQKQIAELDRQDAKDQGNPDIYNAIERLSDGDLLGYDTGYKTINKYTIGLRGFTVLAGAANTGKTTLALNILYNIAIGKRAGLAWNENANSKDAGDTHIIYFSFDMSKDDIARRLGQLELQADYMELKTENKARKADGKYDIEKQISIFDSKFIRTRQSEAKEKQDGTPTKILAIIKNIVSAGIKDKGKVIVCIDYFHCLLTETLQDGGNTHDAERALVNAMIELNDADGVDALLVISEKRKAQTNYAHNKALAIDEIMGSARLGYAPDFVIGIQGAAGLDADGVDYELTDNAGERYSLLFYQCLKARDGGVRSRLTKKDYMLFDYLKNQIDFVKIEYGKPASLENKSEYECNTWNGDTVAGLFSECESQTAGKANKQTSFTKEDIYGE